MVGRNRGELHIYTRFCQKLGGYTNGRTAKEEAAGLSTQSKVSDSASVRIHRSQHCIKTWLRSGFVIYHVKTSKS